MLKFITWLTNNILEVRFDSTYELCDSTYLFSHHYEDPTFRGRIFSRDDLDAYYVKTTGDANSWKRKWAGSNLPDKSFKPFLEGKFNPLSEFETSLINIIRTKSVPFYVIMTSNESLECRNHEIAHAFWYTDSDYRAKCEALVNLYLPKLTAASAKLSQIGYSNDVLIDELHAFCGTFYEECFANLNIPIPQDLVRSLKSEFDASKVRNNVGPVHG